MRDRDLVWTVVFFDLPNITAREKRAHVRFRTQLLENGFCRLQWSVYARSYAREAASVADRERIVDRVPPGGRVRLLTVTDLQFGRMVCIDGRRRKPPEERLEQVVVF